MKIGSLVECVKEYSVTPRVIGYYASWKPKKGEIYTVRGICEDSLGFEEQISIITSLCPLAHLIGEEVYFETHYFRELQEPLDIYELIEEEITELV